MVIHICSWRPRKENSCISRPSKRDIDERSIFMIKASKLTVKQQTAQPLHIPGSNFWISHASKSLPPLFLRQQQRPVSTWKSCPGWTCALPCRHLPSKGIAWEGPWSPERWRRASSKSKLRSLLASPVRATKTTRMQIQNRDKRHLRKWMDSLRKPSPVRARTTLRRWSSCCSLRKGTSSRRRAYASCPDVGTYLKTVNRHNFNHLNDMQDLPVIP